MYTKYRRKTMDELAIKALAKINLGLDVLRRREDGYHEVKMVMQTIHLYDQLHLKKIESGIHLETNLGFLPVDESNLAYRAARLMKEKYQIEEGIDIRLISGFLLLPGWQVEARMPQVCFMESMNYSILE